MDGGSDNYILDRGGYFKEISDDLDEDGFQVGIVLRKWIWIWIYGYWISMRRFKNGWDGRDEGISMDYERFNGYTGGDLNLSG